MLPQVSDHNELLRQPFLVNTPISVSDFAEVHVNHTGEEEDGQIYLLGQSKILFEAAPSEVMNFVVFPSSQIFVYPGRYTAGAGMRLAGAKGTVDFSVSGSCRALNHTNEKVIASCYEGVCSYQINYDKKISIAAGTEVQFDINTLVADVGLEISLPQMDFWLEVLPYGTHARQCVSAFMPVLLTPTKKDHDDGGTPNLVLTSLPPTNALPTNAPPTNRPPTNPPPTNPPPTDPPATNPPAG